MGEHVHDCSCTAVYNGALQDDRGGVYVKGLTTRMVQSEEEALNMLFEV